MSSLPTARVDVIAKGDWKLIYIRCWHGILGIIWEAAVASFLGMEHVGVIFSEELMY